MNSNYDKMQIENQTISCIDTETTGLNKNTDRIIQLSVSNFKICDNKYEIIESRNWYINPTGYWKMNPDAQAIHNISEEFIRNNGTKLKDIYNDFIAMISDYPILTYNGSTFDISFIQREFEREDLDPQFEKHTFIDSFDIEKRMNSNKLSEVYKRYFGTDFEDAHNAESDVAATIAVFTEQNKRYRADNDIRTDNDNNVIEESIGDTTKMMQTSPEGFIYMDSHGVLKFRVGKYKEYPVKEVCESDPGYIKWLFTPNNGDNIITGITKKSIIEDYYRKQN